MISCTSAETFNGLCMMNRIFILHIFCVYSVQISFQYFLYQYFKTFDRLWCKWKYFLFLHYLFLKRHTSIAYKFIVKYTIILRVEFHTKILFYWSLDIISETSLIVQRRIYARNYIFLKCVLYFHEVKNLFWLQVKERRDSNLVWVNLRFYPWIKSAE